MLLFLLLSVQVHHFYIFLHYNYSLHIINIHQFIIYHHCYCCHCCHCLCLILSLEFATAGGSSLRQAYHIMSWILPGASFQHLSAILSVLGIPRFMMRRRTTDRMGHFEISVPETHPDLFPPTTQPQLQTILEQPPTVLGTLQQLPTQPQLYNESGWLDGGWLPAFRTQELPHRTQELPHQPELHSQLRP